MTNRKPLCQRYEAGVSEFENDLTAGRYLAAVASTTLPRATRTENRVVRRGFAVGFGQWFFFDAFEPAIAFSRAARMSIDCLSYGVYEAAHLECSTGVPSFRAGVKSSGLVLIGRVRSGR